MKREENSTLSHGHNSGLRPNQQLEYVSSNSSSPLNIQSELKDLEISIALKKGLRSCTKHPLSKFISYERLSSFLTREPTWT